MRTVPGLCPGRRTPASALTSVVAVAAMGVGLVVLPVAPAAARSGAPIVFHVSPTGSDKAKGSVASGVVYTGTGWDWKNSSRGGAGGWADDVHAMQAAGDSFELAFNGTAIDLITQVNTDEGEVELFLDGRSVGTVDNYNATRVHQKTVFSRTGLTPGIHTLKGVMKTGDYMIVDSFRIH
ncbi:hypothetical protein [Streptomyces sp. NPDC057582]|uniref:hypothetical protein n=1 Tax=unclassified Streptomyces TaxID=2593676 RepID=UPI003687CFC7